MFPGYKMFEKLSSLLQKSVSNNQTKGFKRQVHVRDHFFLSTLHIEWKGPGPVL
jgi:hypothetical protein